MMATFDEGILSVSRPEHCGCQELLNKITLVQYGWLRRKCRRNALQIKYIKWPQNYVIVGGKCIYYFSNETSKSPEGAMSLYGFNRVVRASDIKSAEALWAFKLEHVQLHVRPIYLAAGSEREMVTWMKAIKVEMLSANNIEARFKHQRHSLDSQSTSSWTSGDYKDLEDSVYMEPVGSRISCGFDSKDEVSESENENDGHQQPPLPPRNANLISSVTESPQRKSVIVDSHVDDSSQKISSRVLSLQKKLSLENKHSSMKNCTLGKQTTISNTEENKQSSMKICTLGKQTTTSNTEADSDPENYWQSVYFNGDKAEASEVINRIAEEGVYLIRNSNDNSRVLLLFAHKAVKKFRILDKENGQVSLTRSGPDFPTVEDLLYYYYSNDLPHINTMLSTPYKLSSSYQ